MTKIIESTILEEKETFIHIDNYNETVELCTSDQKVYKRLCKKIGEPKKIFPPANPKNKDSDIYISGASWKYNYFKDRDILKQIFSITNLLPRNKGEEDAEEEVNENI